ncbi:MAG: hypothetical protein QOC96_1001 [Acidobacteriota bacterium]|jgi:hypothetical protein|nr:hypothetical protein [Acidobacteriota bacterium]
MRDEEKKKAESSESFVCLLPCAFRLLFFHPSSLILHPSSFIPAFRASAASVSASITFAALLTGQRTFQSAVIELAFPDGLTFPSSSR